MTVDYWRSTQFANWASLSSVEGLVEKIPNQDITVPKDPVVYTLNAIDSLADNLPKFVRNAHLHYTAMVLAQRYIQTTYSRETCGITSLDGQICCEIATLALHVAIDSDSRYISQSVWDAAVIKVFPCEVVHRGILPSVESGKGQFIETLGFDLYVYHPFETVSLLLADIGTRTREITIISNVAFSIINSLYRTTVIVTQPPYVIAVAAVLGAILITEAKNIDPGIFLKQQPVDICAVESILTNHFYNFIKYREIPLPDPPAVDELPSPSARTGRSVSRHSSRIPSTKSLNSNASSIRTKRKRDDPMSSLAWALLPPLDEKESVAAVKTGYRRSVTLGELRILREISQMSQPESIIKLKEVKTYSVTEESLYRPQGCPFVVNGFFDSSGSQFDSIVRLLDSYDALVNVASQLLSAILFLNELKICHFGIEPQNIMVTADSVKIASLATATILPTIPTTLPSLVYRPPEILMGATNGIRDDPLSVDLWSLGCVLAEITRIFTTRNRYEDPLFNLTDSFPDKPKERFPVRDIQTYTNCRYLMKIADRLSKSELPAKDVWPDMQRRGNFEALAQLVQYRNAHFPAKKGPLNDDIRTYMRDGPEKVMTEIVMALLRWSPERRVNPRVCLTRIINRKPA